VERGWIVRKGVYYKAVHSLKLYLISETIFECVYKPNISFCLGLVLHSDCILHVICNQVPNSETSDWALVAHAYNPKYSGGRDQEDHDSRAAQANHL
jgi:hypothetical protein